MNSDMHCPRCPDDPLLVDGKCESCHGAMLDVGFADDLAQSAGQPPDVFAQLHELHGVPSFWCPACHEKMSTLDFRGERIDWCRRCRGVWLDAAEEARIRGAQMDRSALPTAAIVAPKDIERVSAHVAKISRGSSIVLTRESVLDPRSVRR